MKPKILKITVSKGVTVSVGKFESIRIDAMVELRNDTDNPNAVFNDGYNLVDKKINEQLEEIQDVIAETSVFKIKSKKPKKRGE